MILCHTNNNNKYAFSKSVRVLFNNFYFTSVPNVGHAGEKKMRAFSLVYPSSLSKGNQSWIFIWKDWSEAETPILWPPDAKSWLIGKDPDAGNDWRWEEKGMTENEMVGWHHRLDGHEFEQPLGVGDGQGDLACCRPWGCKESEHDLVINACS